MVLVIFFYHISRKPFHFLRSECIQKILVFVLNNQGLVLCSLIVTKKVGIQLGFFLIFIVSDVWAVENFFIVLHAEFFVFDDSRHFYLVFFMKTDYTLVFIAFTVFGFLWNLKINYFMVLLGNYLFSVLLLKESSLPLFLLFGLKFFHEMFLFSSSIAIS